MNQYKVLNNQSFSCGSYSLVPLRFEDRWDIMKWRNEQIYHLRQNKPLTDRDQNDYFKNIVSKLFEEESPSQILFSYLENGVCIGYGGLVHINWIDRNAEISFIMNTELEQDNFELHWSIYLKFIEKVAFDDLKLHKIYTYAFDLRPHLYEALEKAGFNREARLKDHVFFNDEYIDIVIHSKFKNKAYLRKANMEDAELTYKWVNNSAIREYSFNKEPVLWENHYKWFKQKIEDPSCFYLIYMHNDKAIGSIRLDLADNNNATISYLIDSFYHKKGYGTDILKKTEKYIIQNKLPVDKLEGLVVKENIASSKIFEKLSYKRVEIGNDLRFEKRIKHEN